MPNGNDQYDIRGTQQQDKPTVKLDPRNMQTALELTGMSPELMDQSLKHAADVYDVTFDYKDPEEEFTEEDERALRTLQGRVEELQQPVNVPRPVRGLLPGNEYAVNFGGLSSGLQNLAGGVVRGQRREELYGDPEATAEGMNTAQEKRAQAEELYEMASSLERSGEGDIQLAPGTDQTIQELRADAQALEQEADAAEQAAEETRGVLGRARELEARRQDVLEGKADREEFIRDMGEETYRQSLQAEREARRAEATTEREQIRQRGMRERQESKQKYQIQKAKIEAQAAVKKARAKRDQPEDDDLGWPTSAEPAYVQNFVPEYLDGIENDIQQLEESVYVNNGVIAEEAPPEIRNQYESLTAIQDFGRQLNLDSITYENLQEDGYSAEELPPMRRPTQEEMNTLLQMQQSGVPTEMIDAYKFYNRISLNMAPQGPGGGTTGQAPTGGGANTDFGNTFNPSQRGTGEMLMRNQDENE